MKATISKAQIEVWEGKDSLQEEIKDMELSSGLRYLPKKASGTRKELVANGELKVNRLQKTYLEES
ncbi:MAG: hypothetical protein HYZ34_13420 [Ignavibacteriae bacterium]|nr:hypothetical protein [Ignavibacteriota bacterium]